MKTDGLDERIQKLVESVRQARTENITHTRTHAQQVFILAGAIAAFLMPLYASPQLNLSQQVLVALAIVCFLACILLGVLKLSHVLQTESRSLAELQDALERRDTAVLTRREEEERRRDKRPRVEIIGTAVDALFASGIVLLLVMVGLGLMGR